MLISDVLSTYIPHTLPLLLVAHLMALISPGPDFLIVTGHAIRGRFSGSVFICIGICLANAVYILCAMLGWSAIMQHQNLLTIMQLMGAMYLIYIGYQLINTPKNEFNNAQIRIKKTYSQQFVTGFISAILNPKNMLFYFSLTGLLLGENLTTTHKISASLCMILMVLFYNLLLIKIMALPKLAFHLQRHLHIFEKLTGLVLILMALFILNTSLRLYG